MNLSIRDYLIQLTKSCPLIQNNAAFWQAVINKNWVPGKWSYTVYLHCLDYSSQLNVWWCWGRGEKEMELRQPLIQFHAEVRGIPYKCCRSWGYLSWLLKGRFDLYMESSWVHKKRQGCMYHNIELFWNSF